MGLRIFIKPFCSGQADDSIKQRVLETMVACKPAAGRLDDFLQAWLLKCTSPAFLYQHIEQAEGFQPASNSVKLGAWQQSACAEA